MMLPILISVSVAPVSYLAGSAASAELAARIARAAEKAPNRRWIADILISLIWLNASLLLDWERTRGLHPIFNTFWRVPATESPLRRGRRGPYLVERAREETAP